MDNLSGEEEAKIRGIRRYVYINILLDGKGGYIGAQECCFCKEEQAQSEGVKALSDLNQTIVKQLKPQIKMLKVELPYE